MGMRVRTALLNAMLVAASPASAQNEPGRFALSQVTYQSPVLTAYVDVLDQNGQPPANLELASLSTSLDKRALHVVSTTPFTQSGEGVAYLFLVDASKSIAPADFVAMRTEIDVWIDSLTARDRMAVFSFGDRDRQLIDFTADKPALHAALRSVSPTDNQTRLNLALRNALDVRQREDRDLPSRRVIVVLSDGKDEGSGFTADDVGRIFQQSPIPIYAIGFSALPLIQRGTYLQALNRIAALSGGFYLEGSSLPQSYQAMRRAIRRVFLVRIECPECQLSIPPHLLAMTYASAGTSRTDLLAVSLAMSTQPAEESRWKQLMARVSWKVAALLALTIGAAGAIPLVMFVKARKKPSVVQDVVLATPPAFERAALPEAVIALPLTGLRRIQLTVVSGNERGRVNEENVATTMVVGRDAACNVSYPNDPQMSGRHFELIRSGSHVEVRDLGSMNGTMLNGARLVAQQRVEDGDWIRAGLTEVRINLGA